MSKLKFISNAWICAAFLFILTGCAISSLMDNAPVSQASDTVLDIQGIVYTGASTILTYDIMGIGPDGASFNEYDLAESNYQVRNLVSGQWFVIAYGRDFSGKVIASGYASTNLLSGRTTSLTLPVSDVTDAGALTLSVTWPAVPAPEISAVLSSDGYTDVTLPIQIGPDNHSAFYIDTRLPSRQYQLKLELRSDSNGVWSNTVSVVIVKGEIASIQYNLTSDDVLPLPKGVYAVFSETNSAAERYIFDYNGALYVWNNMNISDSVSPFEGNKAWSMKANAGAWWGMGITHVPNKDLSGYAQGSLKVSIKTSTAAQFKIGVKDGSTEYWMNFSAGSEKFGLQRDGQWHEVAIPFYFFKGITLSNINQLFMLAGDAPASDVVIEVDHIYYDPGPSPFYGLKNVALGTKPNQSSSYSTSYTPDRMADSNSTTLSCTTLEANPWLDIDLRNDKNVKYIVLNTPYAMSNVHLFVSAVPFTSHDLNGTIAQSGVTHYYFAKADLERLVPIDKSVRYVRVQIDGTDYLEFSEIEVLSSDSATPEPALNNVALGTFPNQMNSYNNTMSYWAKNAVDTNVATYCLTKYTQVDPWWETDLRSSKNIDFIRLWMLTSGMKSVHVFVSDVPFNDHNITNTINQSGVTHYYLDSVGVCKTINVGKTGRYVRVQYQGNGYMAIEEAQVMSADSATPEPALNNVALGTFPNQMNSYNNTTSYWPKNAVDTNISTYSLTKYTQVNPWWETDLRVSKNIGFVRVWMYSDGMTSAHVFVSDTPFNNHDITNTINQPGVTHYYFDSIGVCKTINVGKSGRYVRVQYEGTGVLIIDEVEVMSSDAATPEPALNNVGLGTFPNQINTYNDATTYLPTNAMDMNITTYSWTKYNQVNAWWETDLRAPKNIDFIRLWMYFDGMTNVHVFVSDVPFNDHDITNTINQTGVTHYYFDSIGVCKTIHVGKTGRFVRVQCEGNNSYMAIGEIEILSSDIATPEPSLNNVALGTDPAQMNDYSTSYIPRYAIDTNFATYSWTKYSQVNPWWETDLRASKDIDTIRLWMYYDGMSSVHVFLSDTPFTDYNITNTINQSGVVHYYLDNVGICKTIPVGTNARYLRVQYEGTGYMAAKEIQVLSTDTPTP